MLREGMLWHVSSPPDPNRSSFISPQKSNPQYNAPSWSWASCGQHVTYRIQREPDLSFGRDWKEPDASWCVEILDCLVAPRSERNPFGAVQTAYIDIKGSLMPIRRLSGKSKTRPDSCAEDDVALVTDDRFEFEESDLFAPDSINALELIDSSMLLASSK